ncbi:hypothetical protein PHMEG_00012447, partial [Phytophthora megakarya]
MSSALVQTEQQRVALAISKFGGRAREWALTSGWSVGGIFPTWDELKKNLSVVFLPPNHVYRVCSRFLGCRQEEEFVGLRSSATYAHHGMFADPLPEAVTTTVFIDGVRIGVTRTEIFRSWSASFEEAVTVALNAEYNFKSAHASWSTPSASTPEDPKPMDLSSAEEQVAALRAEVVELRASTQRPSIRRCYSCGSPDHLRPRCPLRKARKAASSQATDSSGKRRLPVGAGQSAGEELSSVGPHGSRGGRGQQGLAPKRAVLSNTDRECKPGLLVVEATVKGFDKPWILLIDSGASGNYVRRSTVEGSVTLSLFVLRRVRVTEPKVPLDLGVKFLDFDSTEHCLILDLDQRYDLILSMAWLERHEPWIDWRSMTLGATHFLP